jgi:hypothetical protein
MKGSDSYLLIKFYHKKLKSPALIIMNNIEDKSKISPENINEYYNKGMIKYLIIFPKTQLSIEGNSICEASQNEQNIVVFLTESKDLCNARKDPVIIYTFSDDMLEIELSAGFKKNYSQFKGYEVQETEYDSLKIELKNNIKSWNGIKTVNGIEQIKNYINP